MKIRVQREDGKIETLEIEGTQRIVCGSHLNRISGSRCEHFFTKQGYYGGWGGGVCGTEDADRVLSEMEGKREIEGDPKAIQ